MTLQKVLIRRPFSQSDIPLWLAGGGLTLICMLVAGIAALVGTLTARDRWGRWVHQINTLWGRFLVRLAPVELSVIQTSPIHSGPFVVVSNHQSAIDSALFLSEMPFSYCHFGHRRFFRVLWAMYWARYIPVDHDDPQATRERLLRQGGELLRNGISILVFAEGHRTMDGQMRPFKNGAFELALANRAPILPVAISGSFQLMKKGSFRLRPGRVTIKFLEPIRFHEQGSVDSLREQTRNAILAELEGVV